MFLMFQNKELEYSNYIWLERRKCYAYRSSRKVSEHYESIIIN